MHLAGLELSLTRSEEQINLPQKSPKMLKMASESFNRALLLFLGLVLNSHWVPLETNASTLNLNNNGFSGTLFISVLLNLHLKYFITTCS